MKLMILLALILSGASFVYVLTKDDPEPAQAQIVDHVPAGCGWVVNGGRHNHALVCNSGTLRGFVDWEGGEYIPGKPHRLNVNISGGDAFHRGYVVLSPDNGKGTIMEDGYLHKLLLVRGNRAGGTEFRIRPRFKNSLVICDHNGEGCIDLYRVVNRLNLASVDKSK